MIQEVLQNSFYFVVWTICSGILIAVIIYMYLWNGKRLRITNELRDAREGRKLYDDLSKCVSPSCVRCQNYGKLTTDLLERFIDYRDARPVDKQRDLRRLQASIEAACSSDPDGKPPESDSAKLQNPNVFVLQGLPAEPWQDGKFTSEVSVLEAALPTIKQEYRELLIGQNTSENFDGWLENNVPSGMWSVFHLFNQGERVEDNCARCPKTVAVLDNLQAFMKGCAFGNATFSVLEAGTHITEHYGPSNVRIRCHLGLHVPAHCTLTVARQPPRRWQEGTCLLFDDSFLHEARHAGPEDGGPRVVLMTDFWHPGVTDDEKEALCHLFALK